MDLSAVEPTRLPMALARLHRMCRPGDVARVMLPPPSTLERSRLIDILTGAGFTMRRRAGRGPTSLTRQWTLPDTVGPAMRLLVCGLNPSPAAADTGVGFARPGNRFWPAALDAGLVTCDRDPDHALHHHGVGMTDIVKRTTRRADELDPIEYRTGLARVERLVAELRPGAVCFVGLAGWRAVVDRRASPGWQEGRMASAPVYLMPSTSGLNASSSRADLAAHLGAATGPRPGDLG